MKKILKILVTILLMITVLPMGIYGEETVKNDYVAYSIDASGKEIYYTTIDKAVAASRENKVKIIMTTNWTITSPIEVVEGTTLRIEMNGFSIGRSDYNNQSSNGHVFIIHPSSKLYLYGNNYSNQSFSITGPNGKSEVVNGGLVYGGNASDGGGIYMKKDSELYLVNVSVANNKATEGGGVYVDGKNCNIYLKSKARIENNSADYGAGIYSNADNTHIHFENYSSINSNNCTGENKQGGGVYFDESWFSIESKDKTGIIAENTANNGAGIFVAKKFWGTNNGSIKGLNIESNSSTSDGGGLYLNQNNTTIENCLIQNNGSQGNGGGIYSNGKNTIINSTIIENECNLGPILNNDKEGGGIYCAWGYDVTLSGKVTIKNNYRMNPNYIAWWNHYNKKEYADNYFGKSKDDAFLSTSSVYLIADKLDASSLVGIRTSESEDKKCVKNVENYTFGQTFFMDFSTFHIGYETNDKEIWQRIDTSASTKYTVKVNGIEVGRYTYDQDVKVSGSSKNGIFDYWTSDYLTLDDTQRTSKELTFKMPAYDVDLVANYTYIGSEDATLTVDAPVVGIDLNTTGILNWTIEGVGNKSNVAVTWYEKLSDGTYKQTSGAAKVNTTYIVKTSVDKDGDKNMIFDNVKKEQVKVIYKTTKSETVNHANNVAIDTTTGNLSFEGFDISSVSGTINVNYSDGGIKVEVGTSETELKAKLPSQLEAYSELNSNVPYTIYLDVGNANLSKVNLNTVGTYPVTIPVKEVEGLKFSTYTITCYVRVSDKQATITEIKDTEITVSSGLDGETLITKLKEAFKGEVKAIDSSGKEVECEVGLRYLSNSKLIDSFKKNGLLSEEGKVKEQTEDYAFTRDIYVKSVNNISTNGIKAKFIIHVVPNNEESKDVNANSLENGITVASVDDELSLASNEANKNEVETYVESNENAVSEAKTHTFNEDDYITIPKVTSNLEEKTYTVSDVNTDSVTYKKESGNLSLKVKLSVEKVDGKEPTIKYIKYYQNDNGEWVNDKEVEGSTLTLSASKGESKKYVIEAWSILDGQSSAVDYFTYTIDNTKCTITVITKYNDSNKQVQEPKVLTFDYGQKDVLVNVPLIENNKIFYWVYSGNEWTYGKDECLVKINEIHNNETLTVVYYPAITNFSLNVDSLTVGESLPTINNVTAKLSTGGTENVTSYFDLSNVEWYSNSSSSTVDYDTVYIAKIKINDNITMKYALGDDCLVADKNASYTNYIYEEDGKTYVCFIFNATRQKGSDNKLSYTINSVSNITYDEVSYENALKANNQVDAYNIPYKIKVSLTDNNTGKRFDSYLDVNWNKEFTTSFNPNNYDSQELVINGIIEVPNYYTNSDNINKNVTLRIKVNSKQGYVPQEVIDNSSNKAVTCEEYMKSKDWTWSESKKACVYKVSNTGVK